VECGLVTTEVPCHASGFHFERQCSKRFLTLGPVSPVDYQLLLRLAMVLNLDTRVQCPVGRVASISQYALPLPWHEPYCMLMGMW
jgi:hypothetical protein